MKKQITLSVVLLCITAFSFAQLPRVISTSRDNVITKQLSVGKNSSTKATQASTWLEIGDTTTTKALVFPRVAQLTDIATPFFGMVVYNKADNLLYYRNRTAWVAIGSGGGGSLIGSGLTNYATFWNGATSLTYSSKLNELAGKLGIDFTTPTYGALNFGDATNTTVQNDSPYIFFRIPDKGGYPSVAPRKLLMAADPSAIGGLLTADHGLYTWGFDYAPTINLPGSSIGDIVYSQGYNNPGYTTYKPSEFSFTTQHELNYKQGGTGPNATEYFIAFSTNGASGNRGFRPWNWFVTHNGLQQEHAIRATRFEISDTTSGTPKMRYTPGGPAVAGVWDFNDASVMNFIIPNYGIITQGGTGVVIGGYTYGIGLFNQGYKFKTGGAFTSPGSGTLSIGDATEPLTEGLAINTSSNEKLKFVTGATTLPLRFWYNANTFKFRNNNTGAIPFQVHEDAPNNAFDIASNGNIGIGTGGAPYRLYIAAPSGTVSLGTAGLNTSGDIAHLLSGTTSGYIYTRQSYINAAQGIIDAMDNQNGSSTAAHSLIQLLTQSGGGNPMLRFQRNGVANSFFHIGTKRSNNRFTITNDGNGVEDGNPILDFHPTTLASTFYGSIFLNSLDSAAATGGFLFRDAATGRVRVTAAPAGTGSGDSLTVVNKGTGTSLSYANAAGDTLFIKKLRSSGSVTLSVDPDSTVVISGTNIYNTDGQITDADRFVDGNGTNTLHFGNNEVNFFKRINLFADSVIRVSVGAFGGATNGAVLVEGLATHFLSLGNQDFTILKYNNNIELGQLTTVNRTITLPTANAANKGKLISLININTSGTASWVVSGGTITDAAGTAVSTLTNGKTYQLVCSGTKWYVTSVY